MRTRKRIANASNTPRPILYVRVSTKLQAESGFSIDEQTERLKTECQRRGITDYQLIVDAGQSAKSLKRPGIRQALDLLAKGEYNLLMVTKLDRLARNTRDVLDLATASNSQRWSIVVLDGAVKFDSTTANGAMMLTMMAMLAEWERANTIERINTVMKMKRDRGDAGLINNDVAARIIELDNQRVPMLESARILNADGTPTAKGGKWYASTVAKVIKRHELQQSK